MIKEFQGEYRWLSNFAPCLVAIKGVTYHSVENGYMSAKSDEPWWKRFCLENKPGVVKKRSRSVQLVYNWDEVKTHVMYLLLNQKFKQAPYQQLLINTGEVYIQEGNWWGDKFWGVCLKTNKGENILGKMIMQIRQEINNERRNYN